MARRIDAPPLSVFLLPEDREWLVTFAKHEGVSVHALINHAVWQFHHWQEKGRETLEEGLDYLDKLCREHEKQLLLRWKMRREYEKQLWRERNLRREYEKRFWRERKLRLEYQKQLWRQRDHDRRRERTAGAPRDSLYNAKVARLVALAVCSDSEGEARAAFAKARALHRMAA